MMDAGKLRERVTVQQASETRNALGETLQTWSTYSTIWASVEGVSSRESLLAGQQEIVISHRVRMRWLDGLTQNMRLRWRNRTLDIISILERDNRREHELLCQETI
ncbi:MAG: head-tail adaptor protein [Planctomycetes bacterium]|nr:head-tail adaptor protein [Planctomycetota bacterium]